MAKPTNRIKIAILGASGYTGAELIRLLSRHPAAELAMLTADRHAGKALGQEGLGKVCAVIGDSTFLHGGVAPLMDTVYNKGYSTTIICDNRITGMTGLQEHPGTGRKLDHSKTNKIVFEDVLRAMGMKNVHVIDAVARRAEFVKLVEESLEKPELSVIIARHECLLAAKSIREWERANAESCN